MNHGSRSTSLENVANEKLAGAGHMRYHLAYLTENDEYGLLEEAKVFDEYSDAFDATIDPPWDESEEYDYEIEEIE